MNKYGLKALNNRGREQVFNRVGCIMKVKVRFSKIT